MENKIIFGGGIFFIPEITVFGPKKCSFFRKPIFSLRKIHGAANFSGLKYAQIMQFKNKKIKMGKKNDYLGPKMTFLEGKNGKIRFLRFISKTIGLKKKSQMTKLIGATNANFFVFLLFMSVPQIKHNINISVPFVGGVSFKAS